MNTNQQYSRVRVAMLGATILALILSSSFLWLGCGYAIKQWADTVNSESKP